jgi:hypothetical protein
MWFARSETLLLAVAMATAGCARQPVRVALVPSEIKSSTAPLTAQEPIRKMAEKAALVYYKAPTKKPTPITLPETTVPMP